MHPSILGGVLDCELGRYMLLYFVPNTLGGPVSFFYTPSIIALTVAIYLVLQLHTTT